MEIKIKNLIGIKDLSINTGKIALICGNNGAGKSSVGAAIRMAIFGDVERVGLKKFAAELGHNGAKDYGAQVIIGEAGYSFGKAFGNQHIAVNKAEALTCLQIETGAKKMADLEPEAVAKLLIHLSGISLSTDEIRRRLASFNSEKVNQLIPEIAKSWDAAESFAKTQATGARALWKSITGEAYGKEKAEGWEAIKPDADPDQLRAASAKCETLKSEIDELARREIEALTKSNEFGRRKSSLAEHRSKADKLTECEELLSGAEKALADHKAEISKVEALAAGTPAPAQYKCPCCENKLMWVDGALAPWSHEGKAPDLEAKATLKRLIESLSIREQQVARRKKELDEAKASKAIADELESELDGVEQVDSSSISAELAAKRSELKPVEKEIDVLRRQIEQAATAEEKTKAAAKHHADVKEWEALEKEMSGTGIRQKLSETATNAFNDVLATTTAPGMPSIRIAGNMATHNNRQYKLLSESEQWMVDTCLALAVAQLSGDKIAFIDRMDILHVSRRPAVFRMLSDLAKSNQLESIVVAATLKEPPKLPDPFNVIWLEDGMELVNEPKKAAA